MITKKHYTKEGHHREDVIYQERQFIREINKIIDSKFDKLANDLNLDDAGRDWLFDYIYNCDDETVSFDEYLAEAGLEYTDFVKPRVRSWWDINE